MTVEQIIEYTDTLKPNTFDFTTKLFWVNQVDGIIQTEILKVPIDNVRLLSSSYDKLSVKHPYSQIYSFYIASMIDFFSGDFDKYQNSSAAYNDAMKLYAKYISRGAK